MKKSSFFKLFLVLLLTISIGANAQTDTTKPLKISVFAPLYLDDAFDGPTYKLGKLSLPKNILPGLEFYNGVMMAADSLNKEGAHLSVNIFDTKSIMPSLTSLLASPEMTDTRLIVAFISNAVELKLFAEEAYNKNIPLISATYPNTTGVTANPNFVLLNSTLKTHVEAIYAHLQRNYSLGNIVMVNRKGATENYIKTLFTGLNKSTRGLPLRMTWLELNDSFPSKQIVNKLDSFTNNVVVVASPYENFGLRVVKNLSSYKSYRTTAIGMPTWDGIKDLNGADCKNVDIVYSTPFYYGNNNLASSIAKIYREKFNSRPSDMVYRGYEALFHFTNLYLRYPNNFTDSLSDKTFAVFNQFNIQPVTGKNGIDYYENKHLYFLKKQEGFLKSVN